MTNQYVKLLRDESDDKTNEVAIVGGGLAGLTAAVYLAKNGKNVTIIEKSSDLGGRARTATKNGFYFNQGPHALYANGLGSKILEELNVKYNGNKVDYGKYFVINEGKLYESPTKLSQMLATKLLNGLGSKIEIMRFFVQLNKMNLDKLQRISFQKWLDKNFKISDSKDFVKMLGRISTYTYNAENLSAKLALNQIKTAVSGGVIYIDKGWQILVDQLVGIAKSTGVKFVYGKNVVSIQQKHDTYGTNRQPLWKIGLSDNTNLLYPDVTIATNPSHVYSLLKDNDSINPEFLNQLEKINRPSRVATLDIVLNSLPNPHVYEAYGMDVPVYLSLHSAFAKLSIDGNGVLFHAMKYLDSSVVTNPIKDKLELEDLLDRVQPGWRKLVVKQRFLPNMIASHTFIDQDSKGVMGDRPDMKVPGVDNLYIIGDWVGPEGMLADASFASAKSVALKILGKNRKRIEILNAR
ncbi:phytoene desaturase family protein [Candidatus Nitrosocosmicus franklandus]|uniref:Dehydrosqualene desaturase n=1 Tax=Candidatus Nitrosocosmicus franklandianus TaxID=1798806 RepID=A0A484I958_9ARCH|nr:NAD(P)/FAD-dependent oxidoreductase [Candidatus Nitrosocosmicus franklandus]VFJ13646.1 Dehydrosqualene desaturase [Candidatus Nitrosocosmicus franklandus]